jgi:hypothetical protein
VFWATVSAVPILGLQVAVGNRVTWNVSGLPISSGLILLQIALLAFVRRMLLNRTVTLRSRDRWIGAIIVFGALEIAPALALVMYVLGLRSGWMLSSLIVTWMLGVGGAYPARDKG